MDQAHDRLAFRIVLAAEWRLVTPVGDWNDVGLGGPDGDSAGVRCGLSIGDCDDVVSGRMVIRVVSTGAADAAGWWHPVGDSDCVDF
jgi:hypothetical protein